MSVTPIFILATPRSGSTLLQRVLAAHDGIETTTEPWLLLPLLSHLGSGRATTSANQGLHQASADFADQLPGGRAEYLSVMRDAALRLYTDAAGSEARYFVDKSPPYYSILPELFEAFPDAKFIFLWRNPVAVVASSVELYSSGRWEVGGYGEPLFLGLANLVRAWRQHGDRAIAVRYEELVGGGTDAWRAVSAYLEIEFDEAALERFADVTLSGDLGDQLGAARYPSISAAPLDKWRATIRGPIRRAWCRRYLRWIGPERLAAMGYDLDALISELDSSDLRDGGAPLDDLRLLGMSLMHDLARARLPGRRGEPSTWRMLISGC